MLGFWLAQSPETIHRWLNVGRDQASRGQLRRAEWTLAQVVRYAEPAPTPFFELARVQSERGKLDSAKLNLTRALELKPDFYLCRRLFFEICRREYWTVTAPLLARAEARLQEEDTPEVHLRYIHLLLCQALFSQLRYEIGRLDEEAYDLAVFDRLEERVSGGPGDRLGKKLLSDLATARLILEQLPAQLELLEQRRPQNRHRRARVKLRGGKERTVIGLRDCDDTINYQLEVVTGGLLAFVPFQRIVSLKIGARSDWMDGTVTLESGETHRVVFPLTYFGSRESTLDEVRRGEFTILQSLYGTTRVGIGRRLLTGVDPDTGETVTFGFHEMETITFED